MSTRSPRMILALSATLALTVAALGPTAALARGPNGAGGSASCDGECTLDEPVAQQMRARDGSGANDGANEPVRARTNAADTQASNGNGRNANANRNTDTRRNAVTNQNAATNRNGNANANGQNSKNGAGQGPNEDGQRGPGTCDECDAEMGELTDEQAAGLVFMAEEEKVAHDLYAAFAEQYEVPIFGNIASAEARHQEAVNVVLERYGIDVEDLPTVAGEFNDPILSSLYATMLEEGSADYEAAIGVAVQIEEADIADLGSRMGELETSAPDVYEMYSHLLAGSQNHLQAFRGRQ